MNELVAMLVKQLGVQEPQAAGGAGLLMKLAKETLGAGTCRDGPLGVVSQI